MKIFKRTQRSIHLMVVTITLLGMGLKAQAQMDRDDMAITLSLISKSKKATICNYLEIDQSPKYQGFWKVYGEYESKRKAIMVHKLELLDDYLKNYYILDDAKASRITIELMHTDQLIGKLDGHYFKKFQKLLGGLQATKIFQIENFMQTAMTANIQSKTPIIGEIEKLSRLQHN
ncbi:MAG: hypothetical protein R2819_08965 [Allomuricauda sp.]